ncbi:MAG: hypothetical protein K8R35_06765 [Bacteroidales bacterium]|nr:hypothetical protein [Bacteroidales bacterium]
MAKELLYIIALDENNERVHVNEAEKGKNYYCPGCNGKFKLNNSGKTGKGSNRPHFSHINPTTDCTPEGVLHSSFKKSLIDLLEKYKTENKELLMNWHCSECLIRFSRDSFKANILAKTTTIIEEYNMKVCRPDIALLDAEGKVKVAIEIVVFHKPEEDVLQYYERNGIILIQINLTSLEDLDKVKEKITNPDVVNFCLNPECLNFRNYTSERELIYTDIKCKHCSHPMRTYHVEVDSFFGTITITSLTQQEILEAQSKGVRFKIRKDKTTKEKSIGITCINCERLNKRIKIRVQSPQSNYRNRPFD